MADVTVCSYTNGGVPQSKTGDTPASIAQEMSLPLLNADGEKVVKIYIDEKEVSANQSLRDGDLLSFQKEKVSSGT
tara:strand:+ start:423 stop:650 length:228 start_codon:yes stop_codon:yes gene_type:complete